MGGGNASRFRTIGQPGRAGCGTGQKARAEEDRKEDGSKKADIEEVCRKETRREEICSVDPGGSADRADYEEGRRGGMPNVVYATVQDVTVLFRPLSMQEQEKAEALLPIVSDLLRSEARKAGKNLDAMIAAGEVYASTVKAVTVDVTSRVLRQSTQGDAMSQESQGALGYTWSGTYAIPGGGIGNAILRNDLKRLGLRRQRIGVIELYDPGNDDCAL